MSQEIKLTILIKTQPGKAAQQIDAFKQLAPLVRAEEGCLQYDLHQEGKDPDFFILVERWASKAALDAHDRSEHMIKADAANPTFRAEPATVLFLQEVIA
ncbi:antibiotic biosynthesis monooxygenase [Aquitalea magnusonii]|nr:antibiotic biosynthesis monooxygenase [Aquitalea magnusonii]